MERSGAPNWLTRSAAVGWRVLVLAAVGWVATIVLARLRVLVIPAVLSLFLACLVTPAVGWLRERGVGRLISTILVGVVATLALVGLISFVSGQIVSSLDDLDASVDVGVDQVTDFLEGPPLNLTSSRIEQFVDQARAAIEQNAQGLIGGLAGGAATVLEILTGFVLMIVFAFFVIKDGDRFWHWLIGFVPEERRQVTDRIGERSWRTLRSYLGGTALVGLADAVLIAIGMLIVGTPLVVPLAILIFFGAFFPLVGATVTGILAVLITLAAVGWVEALIVLAIVLGVQRLEGDVLMPILIGKAVDMHPLAIIVALTIGFILAGLIGGFLAVPILAVIIVVLKETHSERMESLLAIDDSDDPTPA